MKYLLIIYILLPLGLMAQIDRVSEAEVQEQAKFLDALQLRILERYDEAIAAFEALANEDPSNDVVQFELAKLYWVKRKDNESAFHARQAIKLNPAKTAYREFLIDLYARTKDYVALNETLNAFIRAGNFDETYYHQLINSYRKTGQFDDALDLLDELEGRIGYKKSIGDQRSAIYKRLGKKRKLKKELERMLVSFPDDAEVLTRCAILLESIDEREEAFKIYEALLEIDPNNTTALKKLATKNNRAKTESDFLSSLEPLIRNEEFPLEEKIKELIPFVPRLTAGSELTTEMLSLMDILQKQHGEDARVNALHGDVYFNTRQPEKAIPFYLRTIDLDKSVFMVWKNLMIAQDKILDFEALGQTAQKAVDYYPNQALCYYYAGKAALEEGDLDGAMDWLQEGRFLTSNNPRLAAEFDLLEVQYHFQKGDFSVAEQRFSKLDREQFGPRHALYFEIKGDLEFQDGQKEKALKSWRQALENGGPRERINSKISEAQNS
jgi:pentatricopeptide repeat protein